MNISDVDLGRTDRQMCSQQVDMSAEVLWPLHPSIDLTTSNGSAAATALPELSKSTKASSVFSSRYQS